MKKVSRCITHTILRWPKQDGTMGYILDIPEITARKVAESMGLVDYEYGNIDVIYSLTAEEFIKACDPVDYTKIIIYK